MDHKQRYVIALGERGRVVLPAPLRRHLDLQPGDRLMVSVDSDGGFHVMSVRDQAQRLLGLYRDLAPGRSLADELITDRRDEAQREQDA